MSFFVGLTMNSLAGTIMNPIQGIRICPSFRCLTDISFYINVRSSLLTFNISSTRLLNENSKLPTLLKDYY